VKVKVALAGHTEFGIEMVTGTDCPARSVPLLGVKVIPETPLLLALQPRLL
jgi:hypothetical protein